MAFNDLERAGIPGEDYYWDIADALDPYRTGFWPVGRNPNDTAISPTASFTASIASFNLNTTGTLTKGSTTITSVASTTGLLIGQQVVAFVPGMPFGTTITAISGSTVTMSNAYSGTTTAGAAINFSGGTLAVTAVASGTLTVGMPIWNANAASGTTITALGTGTVSTGNYQVNKQQTVASGTFTTGGFCTLEGLHPTYICSQLIRDRGAINLNFMKRAPKPGAANDDQPWWELTQAVAAG